MLRELGKEKLLSHRELHKFNYFYVNLIKLIIFRFMLSGVLIYFHWEAMLISYLATRSVMLKNPSPGKRPTESCRRMDSSGTCLRSKIPEDDTLPRREAQTLESDQKWGFEEYFAQ